MGQRNKKKGHIKFKIDIDIPFNLKDLYLLTRQLKFRDLFNREDSQ